jgi:type II secretory pathway component PulJ
MTVVVALATCSLLLHWTVVLLVREVRLRRALQRLLCRLLTLWRRLHAIHRPSASDLERADSQCSGRNRL